MKMTLQQRSLLLIVLALVLAATRSHHWLTWANIPDLTWAVLFVAGFYGARLKEFLLLILLAGMVDVAAIGWGGVSSYCISPAYAMLIPAYACMWLAGRWYARRHTLALRSLPRLLLSASVGAMLAEIFSSGGFYFLSGRFAEPHLAEFGQRLLTYFPDNLFSLLIYVGLVALLHSAYALVVHIKQLRSAALVS